MHGTNQTQKLLNHQRGYRRNIANQPRFHVLVFRLQALQAAQVPNMFLHTNGGVRVTDIFLSTSSVRVCACSCDTCTVPYKLLVPTGVKTSGRQGSSHFLKKGVYGNIKACVLAKSTLTARTFKSQYSLYARGSLYSKGPCFLKPRFILCNGLLPSLDGGLGYIVNSTFNYSDSFPTSACEEISRDEDSTIERPLQSVFHFD